ncbi:MAG: GlxA family transcriptional regulator [Notoacmeibacter sp.]|nr:GlxA family transcriptional regulator [Notoacmeibacter sp.]
MTRSIECLIFEQANLLDISGPLQVFATANDWCAEGVAPYSVALRAASQRVETSSGITLEAVPLDRERPAPDTLLVTGGRGVHEACRDARIVEWLKARAAQSRRVASVCTGAFLLAEAGLLDGRRATTHWMECGQLAARHPSIRVEADPVFIGDGPVWTSAGVTSGIDMALAMVEHDLGHAVAMAAARDLVVFLRRPGGQAQFSAPLSLQMMPGRFAELHAHVAANPALRHALADMATRAGMSERNFHRRHLEETGMTPRAAVERIRVEAARSLMESAGLPVKDVARRCGFGSADAMRNAFERQLGRTPAQWRDAFARTGAST